MRCLHVFAAGFDPAVGRGGKAMVDLETWLAFVAAASVLLVMPGPTIILVISYALSRGRRSAWATVPGVALGDFTAMSLSLLGLGALLATSAELFTVLKWIGAVYLIWLGFKIWKSPPAPLAADAAESKGGLKVMLHAYVVTALNPKSIMFYVAFLPQFLMADRPALPQILILGGTFLVLATLNATAYAILAGQAQRFFSGIRARRNLNRISGGVLMAMGGMLGLMRRAA
jgi:threonine/homoserine/homoserine lactone efflux protein